MISPLLGTPIKGAIWYQGEANAGNYNDYACEMRAMIEGWRGAWQNPPSMKDFTFVVHQLSAGQYSGSMPALRWAQQGAVQRWSNIPNVGLSVGLDLYDEKSPCANIHIRNKSAVGERMALAALAIGYNKSVAYTGPVATTFTISSAESAASASASASASAPTPSGNNNVDDDASNVVDSTIHHFSQATVVAPQTLIIGFTSMTKPLTFKTIPNQTNTANITQGFELLINGAWRSAAASVVVSGAGAGTSVAITLPGGASATAVEGVRYAWAPIPFSQLLFDAAPGGLGLYGLPAPPFWANCSSARPGRSSDNAAKDTVCTLLPPGEVPGLPPAPALGPYVPSPPPSPPAPGPPPGPSPPQCPRVHDVFPTDAGCNFTNNTRFSAAVPPSSSANVALNDYAGCCKACTKDSKCTAASLTHGPKDAEYDFCVMYSAPKVKLSPAFGSSACPLLAVVLYPF